MEQSVPAGVITPCQTSSAGRYRSADSNGWWGAFGKKKVCGKGKKVGSLVHDDLVRRNFTADAADELWLLWADCPVEFETIDRASCSGCMTEPVTRSRGSPVGVEWRHGEWRCGTCPSVDGRFAA